MVRYRFPFPVSRDLYVTRVGGHTSDLGEGEVGINEEAVRQNTSLEGGDSLYIRPFDDRPHPFFRRKRYRLVPLGEGFEDGLQLSRDGEAALPLECTGVKTDKELMLNSVDLPA